MIYLVLACRPDAPLTPEPRLVRFVATPFVQGKPGPRIPVYELPLAVSSSSDQELNAPRQTGALKPPPGMR